MVQHSDSAEGESSVTMAGTVEKIIKPLHPSLPEKAQIGIEGETFFTERFASIV